MLFLITHYVVVESLRIHKNTFHCIVYQGLRGTLLNVSVTKQNPSLNLLLLGSSTFSLAAHIARFEQVHTYILEVHVTNLTIYIYL